MTPEEKQLLDNLNQKVDDMSKLIEAAFNSDGTLKQSPLVIQADGNGNTAGSSVRMETNLGPKDFLIV